MSQPVVLSWSGGKDSALALRELRRRGDTTVVGLLTNLTADHDRISMHGVRRPLLEEQASSIGLPLSLMRISAGATNEEYAETLLGALDHFVRDGVRTVAFGDLFLEEIRAYREDLVARAGMRAVFPLWGRDTRALARDFIDSGFRAIITCVDTHALDPDYAGRTYDHELLEDLPDSADPCGENGEFHTFVARGPVLQRALQVEIGERVLRDGRFMFCDLTPAGNPAEP